MAFTANVVDGQIILASWGNEIRDRAVMVFSSAAERTSQWPTPPVGALSWRNDILALEEYSGGAWGAVRVNNLIALTDIRGATGLLLRDNLNSAQVAIGVAAGAGGAGPTVAIESDNATNAWNALPLALNHRVGAGAPGLGIGNYAGGWAWSILANNLGLHIRNSIDTAYGPISASAFTVNCSAVHKINVTPITKATKAVEDITPVAFDDTRTGYFDGSIKPNHRLGFTAENVAEAIPDLVRGEGRDMTVDSTGLVSVLWQAVKELSARVKVLEAAL